MSWKPKEDGIYMDGFFGLHYKEGIEIQSSMFAKKALFFFIKVMIERRKLCVSFDLICEKLNEVIE